jgi:hypothetical protein
MANMGYSAFDPFSPTTLSPYSPQPPQQQGYPGSQSYPAVPSHVQSTVNSVVGNEIPESNVIFKSKSDNWVQLNISNRRLDLGAPINPPRTFAESYRMVMDQAFENVLTAIARVSKDFESVREGIIPT